MFYRPSGGYWSSNEEEPSRAEGRAILLWIGKVPPPSLYGHDSSFSVGDFLLVAGAREDTHPMVPVDAPRAPAVWALAQTAKLLDAYARAGPYETVHLGTLKEHCPKMRREASDLQNAANTKSHLSECSRLLTNLKKCTIQISELRGATTENQSIYRQLCVDAGRLIVGDYALPAHPPYCGPLIESKEAEAAETDILEILTDRQSINEHLAAIHNTSEPMIVLRAAYARMCRM